jgi:hypothetical protein
MKRYLLLLLSILALSPAYAQRTLTISPRGDSLRTFYLSLNVENGWIAGNHVKWQTGEADHPDATSGNHTHCSAFVAAACKRLNLYVLRPPDHKQELLASAQYEWLSGSDAQADGWKPVSGYEAAQSLANTGMVVIAICKNPDEKKPGHAALVMPDQLSKRQLAEDGPSVIMAGTHNHNKIALKGGFKSHLTEWPEHVVAFFYNTQTPPL